MSYWVVTVMCWGEAQGPTVSETRDQAEPARSLYLRFTFARPLRSSRRPRTGSARPPGRGSRRESTLINLLVSGTKPTHAQTPRKAPSWGLIPRPCDCGAIEHQASAVSHRLPPTRSTPPPPVGTETSTAASTQTSFSLHNMARRLRLRGSGKRGTEEGGRGRGERAQMSWVVLDVKAGGMKK